MVILQEVVAYLENVTGAPATARTLAKESLKGLPVYLAAAYGIHEIDLFGHAIMMAVPKAGETPNLAQLAKDRMLLSSKLGREVILVLPQLKSYERRRLVEKRIPFIVPGRQMFLPMLLVDFREAFPARMPVRKETLSWVAQVMLLRQVQFGDITGRPLVMIAGVLGYSAMAITQGLNELLPLGLCEQAREGRARTIRFEHVRRDLWREAVPHLRSPVKRRYWARDLRLAHGQSLYAGMTALSEATNISTAPKTVFAIGTREARGVEMDTCPFEEDAAIIVEVWAYAPELLSEGASVDPLSLYLSMREDPDERVQTALAQLLEAWT